jgi:hypothetical protein
MSIFDGLDEDDGSSNPFSTRASIGSEMADETGAREPVSDRERSAKPDDPPVPEAQWDEVHGRWERWDDGAQAWVIVGDDPGDGVAPEDENPLPPLLAREVLHAEKMEQIREPEPDVPRVSPQGPAPRGAQWNEVASRWERWDEAAGEWVEATVEPETPGSE